MIGFPTGAYIWIVVGVTDLRRGFTGLRAMVQTGLEQDPFAGHIFVFRGRHGPRRRKWRSEASRQKDDNMFSRILE